jgi:hypothetical protein
VVQWILQQSPVQREADPPVPRIITHPQSRLNEFNKPKNPLVLDILFLCLSELPQEKMPYEFQHDFLLDVVVSRKNKLYLK